MTRQGTSGLVGRQEKQHKRKELISVSADRANFKELIPGVSRATLWGDPETGPYAAFTKFAPGFEAGMHTHSHDVWMVVLKGSYIYRDDEGEKRVGPREFLRIPGGKRHWSGGDTKEGCLFYDESSGNFDLVPAD